MADVVRLVPKVALNEEPTAVENALAAMQLGVETIAEYVRTEQREPRHVVIMMSSVNPDGTVHAEYITANLGRYAAVGLIETIKLDMINKGEA